MILEKMKKAIDNPVIAYKHIERELYLERSKREFTKNTLTEKELKTKYQYWSVRNPEINVEYRKEKELPQRLKEYCGHYKSNRQYLFKIKNGFLCPPTGFPVTDTGKILYQYDIPDIKYYIYRIDKKHSLSPTDIISYAKSSDFSNSKDAKLKTGFPVGTGFREGGYCHWFDEVLPQLRVYEKFSREQSIKPPLIIPQNLSDWQQRSLNLMGYRVEDCIPWDGEPIQIEELLVPTLLLRNSNNLSNYKTNKWGIKWVADRIKSNINQSINFNHSKKIFISREDADKRRVMNQNELMKILKEYGFDSYVLSEMRFEEQVALFANADYVVAPHGAGLVNIIFSKNINILELFPKSVQPHFFILSTEMDHDYDFIICGEENTNGDMNVPITEVVQAIEEK